MKQTKTQTTPILRITRTLGLRLFLVFCIGVYTLAATATSHIVITHDHAESHGKSEHDHNPHSDDGEDDHKNHHDNDTSDGGEHHHHISCHGSVALASVNSVNYLHFHRVMKHVVLSRNETCPTGPIFEIVKPPQVA